MDDEQYPSDEIGSQPFLGSVNSQTQSDVDVPVVGST
jgi:hypothetical protein